ncbi:outer membrane beta-barrel protein [Lutibacter holmesii]|uniref:Outer membrane beta-barrel protein n=1 Tax=Lutibacter holmesii TaxID=1137985 RepID=A0ABW3WMP2_9FLAO
MRDSKNIDRLFQENLKDYEVFPPNKSWNAIENKLNGVPKKTRFPFWAKLSSIAALFVLFFSVGTIYFMPETNFTKNFLPKKNVSPKKITEEESSPKITSTPNTIETTNSKVQNKVIKLNPAFQKEILPIVSTKEIAVASKAKEPSLEKKPLNNLNFSNSKKIPFTGAYTAPHIQKEISESKFTVATIFAPIYFNSFGDGSSVDAQFNHNETSGKSSYSYGVKFSYKLNKKFSLQSGVNLISLGQTTNNVYVTPGVAVVGLSNISNLPTLGKSNADLAKSGSNFNSENAASLNQVFGYIEIPVEIKYNITDGKIGLNVIGGISTLLLNKDEVFVETNSFSQSIGSSNNLRDINFSGNFGLDVDYSIYKNLFINVTPMFKVQTNTFSKNDGGIQSYYLGIYTGLNYKF